MAVAGQVDREERPPESERDRVEGVRVLGAAVDEHQVGLVLAPAKAAQLAKAVDRDEEALDRGSRTGETPLDQVLVEERELVVVGVGHEWHRRR